MGRTRRRLARYDVLADPLHGLLVEDLCNAATLALAFCHAHEITAADLLQHEGLGTIQEWTEDKALHFNIDFALLHNDMKHNVTLQVRPAPPTSAPALALACDGDAPEMHCRIRVMSGDPVIRPRRRRLRHARVRVCACAHANTSTGMCAQAEYESRISECVRMAWG